MMTQAVLDRYEARTYREAGGEELKYRLLRPRDYDPGRRWPLVFFMHGAGERGSDNKAQLKHFAPQIASDENMERYPCFALVPQMPATEFWASLHLRGDRVGNPYVAMTPAPSPTLRLAMEVLGLLEQEFAIDPARIYVTGISMGGYGTWDALARWPERFAAGAPVCGGGDPATAPRFAHKPIWAFHGDADDIVPAEASRIMVEAVRAAGGKPRYTEYPGVGHDSWTETYNNPEFYEWLFAQRRETTDGR